MIFVVIRQQGAERGRGDHRRVDHPVRRPGGRASRWAPATATTPEISFDLGQQIGGPSAGLVFALAIYDKITDGPLLDGRHVAGTGTITPTGKVGAIGGIQEKIAAAEKAGATAFFVPAATAPIWTGCAPT